MAEITEVHAAHILSKTDKECQEVKKKIEEGEKFAKAARRFSTCPSGASGGDLGWFGKGMMVAEFEQAAFAAPLNKVVGPVRTQFGYHLILVTEKR